MSKKERRRAVVMQQLYNKKLNQREAALELCLSIRQIKNLFKNYKKYGDEGLISKKRGSPSNHQLPKVLKEKAIGLILENYIDFGPTLAREKLKEKHGLNISISSVRNLMILANIWHPKKKKERRVYQLRERRSSIGELIQIDGSPHDWFEGRAEKCTLLAYTDDATSRLMELKLVPSETTWNYMNLTKSYIKKYGRPLAFYSDKHSIFRVNTETIGKDSLTQFGRALTQLEIKLICANTPQAKGRVERLFRSLQDRLPKELRLHHISSIDEANKFLPIFIEDYNKRFSRLAKNPINAHRSFDGFDLDLIFTLQETRYLSKNLILQYKNTLYQIKTDRPTYALRKAIVNVLEKESGEVIIEYKKKSLDYKIYHEQPYQGEVISSKLLNHKVDQIKKKQYKPSRNHPWKAYYPRKQHLSL
ncbi:ISNCY family transposase [Candidatus Woesearchaeota archaeon]|nr:ISNCY family transposase [Candidatus Woesearchaeota archaeon]